jgi:prepilin-type N-terminal cleavage/methylation domain-containing protein
MKRGGTLIEVMMACVVLAVIAMAGGAYVYQSMGTLALHRDRSVAVAMANSRMEELRNTPFSDLTNISGFVTSGTNWIKRLGSGWVKTTASEYDSFGLGAYSGQLRAGLQFTNIVVPFDAMIMTVQATYRTPDYVSLTTIYAP